MTYDDGDERVERAIHGIYFRATTAEMRQVMAAVIASPEWAQWAWRDDLIKSHGAAAYHASTMDSDRNKAGLHWICRECAEWFQKLSAVTMREVDAMEAERG